ncbi:hypothetical protein GQ457_03G035140 [Hibiscus cannabinus]
MGDRSFTTILIAIALASRSTPMIPFKFGHIISKSSCHCPQRIVVVIMKQLTILMRKYYIHYYRTLLKPIFSFLFCCLGQVKLWCNCPFWPDDGMCRLRDCSVCECPESEFPESFKKPYHHGLPSDDLNCQEGKPEATVDRTLDSKAFRGWPETDNPWTYDDETDNSEMTYVNLQLNPERYTGYTGPSARRIWDAVYSENCPKCEFPFFLLRVYWGHNLDLLYDRVLRYQNRVQNLYFTFLFVLRAVTKATDYLNKLNTILLLYNPKLQAACPLPFDEARLWKGQRGPELKQKIQAQFNNISALMDCVGCEKCRLWGKLQVLGLGTALKILFSVWLNSLVQRMLASIIKT